MDQRLSGDEVWIDTPVGEDEGSTWGERLESPWKPADETLESAQIQERLREEMEAFAKDLDERPRFIFDNRLTSDDPMTLQQIGDRFGVSRERARQIEARMVKELRERLRERMPDLEWDA
jgi:RNA polymerase sigma-32 factor